MATQAEADELVRKINQEYAHLVAVVSSLSDGQLRAIPENAEGEEQWSPLQQLAHMAEMHRSYDPWVEACLTMDNPDLGTVEWKQDDWPPIMLEQAHDHTAAEMLEELDRRRVAVLARIAQIALADFDRPGTHPIMGTASALQWMKSYYRHYRMHADQIAGRVPEYHPRVVSGTPISQRRFRLAIGQERFRGLASNNELTAAAAEVGWPDQKEP